MAKTAGIDSQSLERAIGGQEALATLVLECVGMMAKARGEGKKDTKGG